ncbi:M20/M25/M40 family metallo-hydrolase [Sphingomonas sp. MAH-20]|uniref:M20/M25/M40 family metallo-hydrolase n=1 Tax=Sphingomonas horti TaxID=2682842 RepID=A0A6I4J128_9SPHN|nr:MULTISPECIES: M20/M25/M40 family metallo-hydrolase [Sphingomonas]MBA2919900.1 M20/M25/M40 family metallo-hydrolase [Sphingomonas sp. CGMCC 1.13658]MVO77783.1 M20/M25/M40 family metallo-hydrolase [Sphingomonas horti]
MMIPKAVLAALLFTASTASVAALSPAEQKITKTVDAEYERSVALLEKLVNQNSGSLNIEGVTRVGEMMRAELEPLGFQVSWIPMTEVKRAGHIVAVHKGNGKGKRMLLIGHLDTVFEKDSPFQTFVRKGDKAEGPGAGDDKGGMVVMVAALRAMQAAGTLKDADIEIVLTGDEEDAGDPTSISRRDLIAAGKRADAALDFEGLSVIDGQDWGSIARRSSSSWTLKVTAKSSHSSGIFTPAAGEGAIYAASRIIAAFRDDLREPNLTYNVGLIAGGTQAALDAGQIRATAAGKTNIIPAIAIARGDMRTLSDEQTERVQAKMKAIVARSYPGAQAEISFDEGYPAMAPTEGNRALLDRLNAVNADLGLKAMPALDPLKRGAGDIAFVAKDVDGLVGLGTDSDGDHAPGETVNLDSIHRQAKRAAILMTRLAREPRGK